NRSRSSSQTSPMKINQLQEKVFLMARVWTQYLGFITGMMLALTGATFILGKIREPESELGAKIPSAEVTVKSMSPGLLLAALGFFLMLAPLVVDHRIQIVARPVYFQPLKLSPEAGKPPQNPILRFPPD